MQLGRLRVMASSVTMFLEHESDAVAGGGYPGGYGAGECKCVLDLLVLITW